MEQTQGDLARYRALVDLTSACRELAAPAGVALGAADTGHELVVRMDRVRLCQVFANLVRNAVQVSPRDSRVALCVRPVATSGTALGRVHGRRPRAGIRGGRHRARLRAVLQQAPRRNR